MTRLPRSSRPSRRTSSRGRTSRSNAACSSSWARSTSSSRSAADGLGADVSGDAATTILVDVDEATGVGTITLNRPEALNALTVPMKQALLGAFRQIERDRAVRAVILTGAGRAFCAGQDLRERL